MKYILALLVVLFLAFPATVLAQATPRADIKIDSSVAAEGLLDAELDELIDQAKRDAEAKEQRDKEQAVADRIRQMLKDDPQLKTDLMKE